MALTLTYDDVLSRVRVAADGLGLSLTAKVERSTNLVTWTTVRGGEAVPTVGAAITLDDYEFAANVMNYYRVTWANTATFVATGAGVSGNAVQLTPPIPTGTQPGDTMIMLSTTRLSPTGVPVAPASWNILLDAGNLRVFAKTAEVGETAPTLNFTGIVANTDVTARIATFRNAVPTALTATHQLNASAQNVAFPALTVDRRNPLLVRVAWKQDDWTSITPGPASWTSLGDVVSTAGDDAAQSWSYWTQSQAATSPAGTYTVTGGAAAISRAGAVAVDTTSSVVSGGITPVLDGVWVKSITRPFLNRELGCVNDVSAIERPARHGVFEVIGRSLPVGVTDVRGSRRLSVQTITQTTTQRQDFDLVLASGDPVFIHAPPDSPVPTMYAVVDTTTERRPLRNRRCGDDWRVFELPLVEVAAPGPDVVGATSTWQSVLNTYATWADVLAAKTTWAALLELVGDEGEVIVP